MVFDITAKRKCGADFVYLIEGCGEPEENKRCNTPHLNRYGNIRRSEYALPSSKQEMSAVRRPLFIEIATFSIKDSAKTLSICLPLARRNKGSENFALNNTHYKTTQQISAKGF